MCVWCVLHLLCLWVVVYVTRCAGVLVQWRCAYCGMRASEISGVLLV